MADVTCVLDGRVLVVWANKAIGWGWLRALRRWWGRLLENHVAGRTFEATDWRVDKLEIIILGLNR